MVGGYKHNSWKQAELNTRSRRARMCGIDMIYKLFLIRFAQPETQYKQRFDNNKRHFYTRTYANMKLNSTLLQKSQFDNILESSNNRCFYLPDTKTL